MVWILSVAALLLIMAISIAIGKFLVERSDKLLEKNFQESMRLKRKNEEDKK